MRISKQRKKTTLAQQGRYLLICLLSMMLLFLAGSMIILNRTQRLSWTTVFFESAEICFRP